MGESLRMQDPFLFPSTRCRGKVNIDVRKTQSCVLGVLGVEPRASRMLDKHFTTEILLSLKKMKTYVVHCDSCLSFCSWPRLSTHQCGLWYICLLKWERQLKPAVLLIGKHCLWLCVDQSSVVVTGWHHLWLCVDQSSVVVTGWHRLWLCVDQLSGRVSV